MPDAKVAQEEVARILRDWSEIQLFEALAVLAAGVVLALAIMYSSWGQGCLPGSK